MNMRKTTGWVERGRLGTAHVRVGLAALLLVGSLGAGCLYPVRRDAECTRRISECLGDCRDDPGHERTAGTEFDVGTDTRTACERRCDALCR